MGDCVARASVAALCQISGRKMPGVEAPAAGIVSTPHVNAPAACPHWMSVGWSPTIIASAGAGLYYLAWLKTDGTLWGQGGDNSMIQFGDGTTIVSEGFFLVGTTDQNRLYNYRQHGSNWVSAVGMANLVPDAQVPQKLGTSVGIDVNR